MASGDIFTECEHCVEAVHHRHRDVANDQVGHFLHRNLDAVLAVGGDKNVVLLGKKKTHDVGVQIGLVLDDQEGGDVSVCEEAG